LRPPYERLLEFNILKLKILKNACSMLKMSYTGCPGPSPAILAQFTLKCLTQTELAKKFTKNPLLGVQGRSGSSTLINLLKSLSSVLVTTSSMSVPICNRFHTNQANNSRITSFSGVPLFDALVQGEPLHLLVQNFVIKN